MAAICEMGDATFDGVLFLRPVKEAIAQFDVVGRKFRQEPRFASHAVAGYTEGGWRFGGDRQPNLRHSAAAPHSACHVSENLFCPLGDILH